MRTEQAEITRQNPQQYSISGTVDFATVPALLRTSSTFIKNIEAGDARQMTVDMSQVTSCNSAALALMLEMAKQTHLNNITLHFEHLPQTLLTIAKAYGVENEIRDICQ